MGATAQFIDMAAWKACGEHFDRPRSLQGRPCYAGLDLGATKDMTALVLVFAGIEGEFDVMPVCWLPGEQLSDLEDADRNAPYRLWVQQCHLLTSRPFNYQSRCAQDRELHGRYNIRAGIRSLAVRRHQTRALGNRL